MDATVARDPEEADPITIKAYKYNGLWCPQATSTCPLVPKYHRTYGRPSLYESMAQEIDRKTHPLHNQQEMESLSVKRDRIIVDQELREIQILNEFGQQILYSEAINDLVELEEEMIKVGSYFINQHEYYQANNDIEREINAPGMKPDAPPIPNEERPSSMIDRAEVAYDLFTKESRFQFAKVKLVELLLEAYENTVDPLESVRVLQQIVDTMGLRPRLNMEATFYTESYESEIEVLENRYSFFKEVIDLQKTVEEEENAKNFRFQQLKMMKVTEAVRDQWKLKETYAKRARDGSDQSKGSAVEDDEQFAERMRTKILTEQQKVEGKKAIAKRHITEFANDQYTNFATILGLPEISLEDLVGKKDQREPVINDAIREKTFFAKQTEGYPSFFSEKKMEGAALGLHTENIGICDFYESLAITPKVNAAMYQAFENLKGTMAPENGFAASCLELCMIREARAEIKKLQILLESDYQLCDVPGQNLIEEDFYLANSDKLIFAMKEFKADMEPS